MIGQRGVPAAYGGVERHVEELGSRLVSLGHEVTVFVRPNYVDVRAPAHRGMQLRYTRTLPTKHLEAIVHSTTSTIAALWSSYDIIHYHAVGPGIPAVLPRALTRSKVVQTIHGLDGDRDKWSGMAKRILKAGEWLSAKVPDATIVVSNNLAEHYRERYGRRTWHIPNGVCPPPSSAELGKVGTRLGVQSRRYVLFVGRVVPEKAPDQLMAAFRRLPYRDLRLVIAGGSSFTDDYFERVQALAAEDDRIRLAGYVYGTDLAELYANAAAFVLPSTLEGLPLTLLEAASFGTPVVASDIAPHLEVIGSEGPGRRIFEVGRVDELAKVLMQAIDNLDTELAGAEMFADEILRRFSWDTAARQTLEVYEHSLGRR